MQSMRLMAVRCKHLVVLVGGFLVALQLAACGATQTLHPSFSLRFKEMQMAQGAARGTHDPVARGEEGARAVQSYYMSFSPQNGMGGGGGMVGGGLNSTAGVPPLH